MYEKELYSYTYRHKKAGGTRITNEQHFAIITEGINDYNPEHLLLAGAPDNMMNNCIEMAKAIKSNFLVKSY